MTQTEVRQGEEGANSLQMLEVGQRLMFFSDRQRFGNLRDSFPPDRHNVLPQWILITFGKPDCLFRFTWMPNKRFLQNSFIPVKTVCCIARQQRRTDFQLG